MNGSLWVVSRLPQQATIPRDAHVIKNVTGIRMMSSVESRVLNI